MSRKPSVYLIGEIIISEKFGEIEVIGYDKKGQNRIVKFKEHNVIKSVQVGDLNKGIASPKVFEKWDEEKAKSKLLEKGFLLLEPFKGKIILKHHIKCLKCGNDHYINGDKYTKSINGIINRNDGCGFCSGRYATKENNLTTHYKEILKYWDFTKNKVNPHELLNTSHSKVYVICPICNKSKLSDVRSIGQNRSCICQKCTIKSGEEHPNYNASLTDEERIIKRDTLENIKWRNEVYEKDNYTCQCCGERGGNLNAHHLNGYNWFKEGRFDRNNGVTLCKECHEKFHKLYKYKDNTIQQYREFIKKVS